eukprot:m.470826 g.470826  ORF g.470826 m.470826 type:complete len:103 (+) comp30323_c0_seq1:271-579(+)
MLAAELLVSWEGEGGAWSAHGYELVFLDVFCDGPLWALAPTMVCYRSWVALMTDHDLGVSNVACVAQTLHRGDRMTVAALNASYVVHLIGLLALAFTVVCLI